MQNLFRKVGNTVRYHYYRKKNNWEFPSNMVHTSGAQVAAGTYEPDLSNKLVDSINEGATVIDIGANVGYYARLIADTVRKSGRVIAFEIESENYLCLCKNVADYKQVTPLALAVSNENGITEFHKSSHSSCHSILKTGNYQSPASIKIATIKLDTFWELYLQKSNVDCVKIDVEGAEVLVLDGMEQMLKQDAVRSLIVELCPQIIINSGFSPLGLYQKLAPLFAMEVIESEFQEVTGNGKIENEEQFVRLKDHLLESGDFLNCNLYCERI